MNHSTSPRPRTQAGVLPVEPTSTCSRLAQSPLPTGSYFHLALVKPQCQPVCKLQVGTARKPAALDLCERFKISLRSAYRHLQRGTTPASERRKGRDGVWHPAGNGGHTEHEPALQDLRIAQCALNRASRRVATEGCTPAARAKLAWLIDLASATLAKWRTVA